MLNTLFRWFQKDRSEQDLSDDEVALLHDTVETARQEKPGARKARRCLVPCVVFLGCILLASLAGTLLFVKSQPKTVSSAILELPRFPDARNASEVLDTWRSVRDAAYPQNRERVIQLGETNLKAREQCLQQGNCLPNQEKIVVIMASDWLQALLSPFYVSGEQIWARSANRALEQLNYTVFYSFGSMADTSRTINQRFPSGWDDVHMLVANVGEIYACVKEANCVYSNSNRSGVKFWKVLSYNFWGGEDHPLGKQWVLMPEDYDDSHNQYLGYSVEDSCTKTPYIEPKVRFGSMTKANALRNKTDDATETVVDPTRRVAYLLAKKLSYLGNNAKFGAVQFAAAYEELNIRFEMGTNNDSHVLTDPQLIDLTNDPAIFENHGKTRPDLFQRILSTSSILIGLGDPASSPTPHEALCLGVPFINPINSWDKGDPTNRKHWGVQHATLKYLDPPYVYNVFQNDTKGFVNAIRSALANPIPRHIQPKMRQSEVTRRFGDILARDHRMLMQQLMEERVRTGKGRVFDM